MKEKRPNFDPNGRRFDRLSAIAVVFLIAALVFFAWKAMAADAVATSTIPAVPSGEGGMSSLVLWLHTAALPALVPAVFVALIALAKSWSTKSNRDWKAGVLERLLVSADVIVRAVQQKHVARLEAGRHPDSPGGVIVTEDEADAAFAVALAELKTYWGPKGLNEIAKVIGADGGWFQAVLRFFGVKTEVSPKVDQVLGNAIEAAVHSMKTTQKAVARATGDIVIPAGSGATISLAPPPMDPR